MTILEKITAQKQHEIQILKNSNFNFDSSPYFKKEKISLKQHIQSLSFPIIAEFKRQSPSKGIIHQNANPVQIAKSYENAAGISVLTDQMFFGAQISDFKTIRDNTNLPILRKDFILNEIQILESKSIGANVILLIAKILTKKEMKHLINFAHNLELEVLLECHNQAEILKVADLQPDFFGINNRNLETFSVDFQNSYKMAELLPKNTLKIAESGIQTPDDVKQLKAHGFDAFLIGETFMKKENPGKVFQGFHQKLNA